MKLYLLAIIAILVAGYGGFYLICSFDHGPLHPSIMAAIAMTAVLIGSTIGIALGCLITRIIERFNKSATH